MGEPKLDDKTGSEFNGIDMGRPDSLRYNVLSYVSQEEYERAIKMLKDFIENDSEYPNFRLKVERYSQHSIDLIFAIRTKRNFPGLSGMTLTKQQELKVRCKEHFSELSQALQKIEKCLEELRLDDVKSTKIVVKAIWFSALTLFCAALFLEFSHGLLATFTTVISNQSDVVVKYLIEKIL